MAQTSTFLKKNNILMFNYIIFIQLFFQWARIVLVVERSVDARKRLFYQKKYSEISNGKRVFIMTWEINVSLLVGVINY